MAETTTKASTKKPAAAKPVASETKAAAATEKKPAAKKAAAPKAAAPKAAAKKPAAKKGAGGVNAEQRYNMVQEAAYYLAERDSFNGDPLRYWMQAEVQIDQMIAEGKL